MAPRIGVNRTFQTTSRPSRGQRDYLSQQSGSRRHEFSATATGTPLTLTAGLYFFFELLKFRRTFTAGDDVPPTATASNNFQTPQVFNGSKIINFQATIRIKNRGAVGGYLDVYQITASFYDILIWDTLFTSTCPLTFNNAGVGPPDKQGEIGTKAITTTLILDNAIKNSKFTQHYMKKMGTIFITNEDGGNGGEVTMNLNRVPSKCRRSQTGMWWGLFFHNHSDLNGAETLVLDATIEESFEEIPSDNRLPFLT